MSGQDFFDKLPDFVTQKIRLALKELRMICYCQTCGEIFINIDYDEYSQKHLESQRLGEKEKWLTKAGLHWCENPEHQIISNFGGIVLKNTSEDWKETQQRSNHRLEQMFQNLTNILERSKALV